MTQTQIDHLRAKMQAEAAEGSRYTAGMAAAQQAQAQIDATELAQRHPDLLQRRAALEQERHEQRAELQEARHQLAALRTSPQPDFQRGAELTFRAQWLEEQIAQKDQDVQQLDVQIAQAVQHDAIQLAKPGRAEYNRLIRARAAALDEVERAKAQVMQQYEGPIKAAEAYLMGLAAIAPIDLTPIAGGLLREQ